MDKNSINDIRRNINECNVEILAYRIKYIIGLLKLQNKKFQIIKLSKKYANIKIKHKTEINSINIEDNNYYFGEVCKINKEIVYKKNIQNIIKQKLNKKINDRKKLKNELKKYKEMLIYKNDEYQISNYSYKKNKKH